MMESLREIFFKTDRSTIKLTAGRSTKGLTRARTPYSMFDVHQFLSRFVWTLAASGGAHMKLEHRTSEFLNNITEFEWFIFADTQYGRG
jgi:hypothetical protein